MTTPTFHLVDVFAETRYAGNQLAVFRNVGGLSDTQMQSIAREVNFSETTFILSDEPREGGYDVRIFTPTAEVPFAGHPTLGTASVIRRVIIGKPAGRITLNLGVGPIPVDFEPQANGTDIAWMTPGDAAFGETVEPSEIAPLLSLADTDIDPDFPVQSVSTGLPFILVPLRALDAVQRAELIKNQWLTWVRTREAKTVFLFCREPVDPGNHIHARMFADYYGIPEDPATGSANCCLAAYLVKHRYFRSSEIHVRVEQGYELGRPSLIYLRANQRNGDIGVNVGGKVCFVARGEWLC
jgi:trans-2,3-dihydro-3-hydroxyanthranilate isomerase